MCKVLVGGGALRNVRLDLVRVIGLGLGFGLGFGLEVRVGGGALRNVRLDLLGAQRGVRRLSHDVGLGQLPGALVGHADDGGVGDAHVAEQYRLELGGRHLEALDLVGVGVGVEVKVRVRVGVGLELGSEFRVQSSEFRVQSSEFRVQSPEVG